MALTIWTVRISFLLYVAALALMLADKRGARVVWAAGFLAYLAHVAAAFHYFHHWSHAAAYQETARQTEELFGFAFGGGLYFNYAFTVVWGADVLFRFGSRWAAAAVHGFLAFMFFNGTVVFAQGWSRWAGVAATALLAVLWRRFR